MATSIDYDNEFIVGGAANTRLTPNFKLKEFVRSDGTIFVHPGGGAGQNSPVGLAGQNPDVFLRRRPEMGCWATGCPVMGPAH